VANLVAATTVFTILSSFLRYATRVGRRHRRSFPCLALLLSRFAEPDSVSVRSTSCAKSVCRDGDAGPRGAGAWDGFPLRQFGPGGFPYLTSIPTCSDGALRATVAADLRGDVRRGAAPPAGRAEAATRFTKLSGLVAPGAARDDLVSFPMKRIRPANVMLRRDVRPHVHNDRTDTRLARSPLQRRRARSPGRRLRAREAARRIALPAHVRPIGWPAAGAFPPGELPRLGRPPDSSDFLSTR
jgi:hypothetical protein